MIEANPMKYYKELADIDFEMYEGGAIDGETNARYYIDGVLVTHEEWQETADYYFAIRDQIPNEEQQSLVFSEWIRSLDITIEPLPLSTATAARIYSSFLVDRGGGGYDENDNRIWVHSDFDYNHEFYLGNFAVVCDLTGDGIPELFLPTLSTNVWSIRDRYVVLLGSVDEFIVEPEHCIPFPEWYLTFADDGF